MGRAHGEMGEKQNAYKISAGKPGRKCLLGRQKEMGE
jgi:hypothetical protein